VVLGGGGGASSTGVANRLLLVPVQPNDAVKGGPHKDQLKSDPASELHTGDITTVSGTWVQNKPYFVAVLSGGAGLSKYKLGKGADGKEEFREVEVDGGKAESFKQAEIKTVASNASGTRIAVGYNTGKIVIYDTETMGEIRSFDPEKHEDVLPPKGGIMNLCYSPCGGKILVVKDSGVAFVWESGAGAPASPSKKKKKHSKDKKSNSGSAGGGATVVKFPQDLGTFRGCYAFQGGDGKPLFCLGVNCKDRKSRVSTWRIAGGSHAARQVFRYAHGAAMTALAGHSGEATGNRLVATASSEGDVCVFSAGESSLTALHRVSNAHMIFVTDLSFSRDGRRLVSVSADAGARITCVTRSAKQIAMQRHILLALLPLLVALIIALVRQLL